MKKLKEKWGIESNFQLVIILIVFSITGTLSTWAAKPLTDLAGLERSITSAWIYWPVRIFIIFPLYQVLIVLIGALFGQYKFFWAFEKKMLYRLGFKQFKQD